MTINAISVTGVKVACARRIVWSKWVIYRVKMMEKERHE